MTNHLAVMPTGDCRRLRHPDPVALTLPTGDQLDACPLCTAGWRIAHDLGGRDMADRFVQRLRAETEPYPADAEPGGVGPSG